MWLIIDNSPENLTLLKKLNFRFPKSGLFTQEIMDIETDGLFAIDIKISNKNASEYIPTLPENFLEQISLLESIGMKPEDIIGVLKG